MPKFLSLISLFFFLVYCGESNNSDWHYEEKDFTRYYQNWIPTATWVEWKDRELICWANSPPIDTGNATSLQEIVDWVNARVVYKQDVGDYWQTTCETMAIWQGDCEDIAFMVYRILWERGYTDDVLGIIEIERLDRRIFHTLVGVYFTNNDFWVLDNGAITTKVRKATEVLTRDTISMWMGFNMTEWWYYQDY